MTKREDSVEGLGWANGTFKVSEWASTSFFFSIPLLSLPFTSFLSLFSGMLCFSPNWAGVFGGVRVQVFDFLDFLQKDI